MISKIRDYTCLLTKLREIANTKYFEIDRDEIDNDTFITYSMFCQYYCYAYAYLLKVRDNKDYLIDRNLVDQALNSYTIFNYFINTSVKEYMLYDDIGVGKITYAPYQPLADFFFETDDKKEILMRYLRKELSDVFKKKDEKRRVK